MSSEQKGRLPIEPISRFAKQSLSRQPVEITSFSYDANRQLHHDNRSLSYYWPAEIGVNLSDGLNRVISRDEGVNEHIDAILEALMAYERDHGCQKTKVDIVTWRGLVTKLVVLPYSRSDGFELHATRLGDTVYIEEYVSPEARAAKAKREDDPRQRMMAYWGRLAMIHC